MTKPLVLSRHDGELLLRLLERKRSVIAAPALEELFPETPSTLLSLGALETCGTSRTTIVAGNNGPEFRNLAWEPDRNAYGYFDAADGNVVLAPEAQTLFRVNQRWWLAWLGYALNLTNSSQPTEIVPERTWDIGDLWITRDRKIPVLFARRLHLATTLQELREAVERRIGRSGGLILTSARKPLRDVTADRSFRVTPITDVLTNDEEVFAIDRKLLLSPYVAPATNLVPTQPLYLSPDGRQLVINGAVTIHFKSDVHIAIIRYLVMAHEEGRRYRASEVLAKAGSGLSSFGRAFGTKKWSLLKPYLKSKNGLWGFDL